VERENLLLGPPQCLCCGFCCVSKKLSLPSGDIKPAGSKCPHLEEARIQNGSWQLAGCKIYNERPNCCKIYHFGPGPCFQGLVQWENMKPEAELPQKIKEVKEVLES